MNKNLKHESITHPMLYNNLNKLNTMQFKTFYALFVHYWATYRYFISNQNFLNLWCELNELCYEFDESFPDPYDDHNQMASFCKAHPYYFIDILPIDLIATLFSEFVDDRIDILTQIVDQIYEADIIAAYTYANKELQLDECVYVLVSETQDHIKYFS